MEKRELKEGKYNGLEGELRTNHPQEILLLFIADIFCNCITPEYGGKVGHQGWKKQAHEKRNVKTGIGPGLLNVLQRRKTSHEDLEK